MWWKVWEEQREESIYTHMALSSENLLLLILMMEMKHFQLTHMNTLALTHFHTCRVTLWLGGDSANTLCVILLARLWLLRCRWQSNKRIWDWLVIVGPANRPWRGGSLQSSWANKGLLLLMATHTHTHTDTHTHTKVWHRYAGTCVGVVTVTRCLLQGGLPCPHR